uniref:Uncharacterized protein n=2 Tax=Cryptomonas curvata TaxID=233186 RepID=A0A7S0QGB7_9CRYP|mmetsp:Transcript_2156/g.4458  ORF Transcript_2156/g.4458 Transcript_2156/m.4458 type:complete len:116 (+) Transcript_2156:443-790(+)
MHPPGMAAALIEQFPLEDQGLILMFGPLPPGATSYPAQEVFEGKNFLQQDSENGYGLMFRVEGGKFVVQFGNGVQRLDHDTLKRFKLHATGIPSPQEPAIAGTVDGPPPSTHGEH